MPPDKPPRDRPPIGPIARGLQAGERLLPATSDRDDANAMDLEVLDGFLTVLFCGPENVPPSEHLAVIWGNETISEEAFPCCGNSCR